MERLPWDVQAMVARYLPVRNGFEPMRNRKLKPTCSWVLTADGATVCRLSHGHNLRWCRLGVPLLADSSEGCKCSRCSDYRKWQWKQWVRQLKDQKEERLQSSRFALGDACERAKRKLSYAPAKGYCYYIKHQHQIPRHRFGCATVNLHLRDGRRVTAYIYDDKVEIY